MTFDKQFRDKSVKGVPVETRSAQWFEYLPGMAKMLGLFAVGLVVDSVMEGLTGSKTNFAQMAQLGGTAWYMFGPGAPQPKQVEAQSNNQRPPQLGL